MSPDVFYPRLAIIPAKSLSERCPGKNLRRLAGTPLFLHSVYYALHEGFVPVVSTDSEEIISLCKQEKINYIREVVDDSKMENCIYQVLESFSCDIFALLQPSSPLRKKGLLEQMANELQEGSHPSAYTAEKTKVIGHLNGEFQNAYREQDATRFLYFFDGNIVVIRQKVFQKLKAFFNHDSRYYLNPAPCNLQIDTEDDFNTISHLCTTPVSLELLAPPDRRMKVCIVSNKRDLKRNYSSFIDACDKVLRISKMDNLDSGLTGTRTDLILISCFHGYLSFKRKDRHMDALMQVPDIYFNNEEIACATEFAYKENLKNWKFLPKTVHDSTDYFTTLSKGLCLADYLFPNAQLYYLGDRDAALRAPCSKHAYSKENVYMESLIDSGRLIHILEDEADEFHYSEENKLGEPACKPSASHQEDGSSAESQIIQLRHPKWNDLFRITDHRGIRLNQGDEASVLKHDGSYLLLKWDDWGIEEFVKEKEGQYRLLKYQYNDTVNEVSKYDTRLFINTYDGSNSVFRFQSCPFIGIGYSQWDFLLLLDRMYEDIEKKILRMPRLKSVLFVGICKDSLSGLYLALRFKENYPHLNIGVWGCAWAGNYSGETLVYKDTVISPNHALICERTPYRQLLALYGDPLAMLQKAGENNLFVHLFAFYSQNSTWEIDRHTTCRLKNYITKCYLHRANEDEPLSYVHGKILQLGKQDPSLLQSWIDEMFEILSTKTFKPNALKWISQNEFS